MWREAGRKQSGGRVGAWDGEHVQKQSEAAQWGREWNGKEKKTNRERVRERERERERDGGRQ